MQARPGLPPRHHKIRIFDPGATSAEAAEGQHLKSPQPGTFQAFDTAVKSATEEGLCVSALGLAGSCLG